MLTIGGILLLLALVLAIPVNLVYAIRTGQGRRGRIRIYWLFGRLHFVLRPRRREKRPGRKRRQLVRAGRGAVRRRRDVFAVLRTPGLIRRTARLLGDLSRAMRPRRFRLELVIGMEDPADTGRLWGLLAPLRLLFGVRSLGKASNISVEITPDFVGPRFSGYSCASVRFVPLQLIGLLAGFALSGPVMRAARTYLRRSAG